MQRKPIFLANREASEKTLHTCTAMKGKKKVPVDAKNKTTSDGKHKYKQLFLICILSEAHGGHRAELSAKSQLTTKALIECYKTKRAGYEISSVKKNLDSVRFPFVKPCI